MSAILRADVEAVVTPEGSVVVQAEVADERRQAWGELAEHGL